MNNVKHCPTTAYRPQANGVVERANAVIKERLRALATTHADWDMRLPTVTSSYNRTIHSATGYAPFHAFYMREPFSPSERMLKRALDPEFDDCDEFVKTMLPEALGIVEEVTAANATARARNKAAVDAKYQKWLNAGGPRGGDFAVGDKVWLAVPAPNKLTSSWRGPLVVVSRKDLTYRLGIPTGGRLPTAVHANRLWPFRDGGITTKAPDEDVDTFGVDWDAELDPIRERSQLVQNRGVDWRVTEVLKRRQNRHGNPRYHWLVRCNDGALRWTPTHNVDKEFIIKYNVQVARASDIAEGGATVARVSCSHAQAW